MNLEHFPTSERARAMLNTISADFYEQSYVGKWLFQVMGMEMDEVRKVIVDELPLQAFPETATWGLRYHEEKYGLDINENMPYKERRARIIEKRESKYSVTPKRMETVITERFGAEVHVYDVNDPGGQIFSHPNVFIVMFRQNGTEQEFDIQAARDLIDRMKQSHTVYNLLYDHYIWVEVNAGYHSGIIFTTGVAARMPEYFKYISRRLDGIYRIDGSYRLNGYLEEGASGRLYNAGLLFGLGAKSSIEVSTGYGQVALIVQEVKTALDSAVAIIPINESAETKPAIITQSDVCCESVYAAEIKVEQNIWYLDGTYSLDGSKKINAKRYMIEL